MRRLASLAIAAALLAVTVAPAAATTPVDERRVRTEVPLGAADFTLPKDEGCGDFDVLVEDVAGKIIEVFITEDRHGNVLTRTIFHTIARYTNLESGKTFDRRFDSVGNYTWRPDGTLKLVGRNDILIWGPEPPAVGLTPGLWLIDKGRIVLEYDAAWNPLSAELQYGETIDVCALLR